MGRIKCALKLSVLFIIGILAANLILFSGLYFCNSVDFHNLYISVPILSGCYSLLILLLEKKAVSLFRITAKLYFAATSVIPAVLSVISFFLFMMIIQPSDIFSPNASVYYALLFESIFLPISLAIALLAKLLIHFFNKKPRVFN